MKLRVFFNSHFIGAFVVGLACYSMIWNYSFSQPTSLQTRPYQLTPSFFRWVTGGFWPAAVDSFWIQTIQTLSSKEFSDLGLRKNLAQSSLQFYRLATELDPQFYELYEQAGLSFLFFYEEPKPAIEMLEKGIRIYESGKAPPKFWTHPFTLYLYLANVYAFQLHDWKSAKAAYLAASNVPNSPKYLLNMKDWLEKENSELMLAKKVLAHLINHTDDELIRNKYQRMLKAYE